MPELTTTAAQSSHRRFVTRVLLVGVVLIFGGEAFCVLGPHENSVHIACHVVLYAGMFLLSVGVLLEARRRLRDRSSG
jgi:hypothetical protein